MVMASKQSAKSNKMSDSESDGEQEIVEKKGVSKRKAAPAASSSKVTKKAVNKRAAKVDPGQKIKKEPEEIKHESESEESDADQKVPLLDQPLELSGARDRKQVDRFNVDLLKGGRRHFDIEIPAGKGTRLKDIPSISYELKKSGSDDLKTLHRIMYSRIGNVSNIKPNILMFNGFSFDKNDIPYRRTHTALSKLNMIKLKSISQMLCLPKSGKQADYIERILDFLLEPTDTGKAVRESRPERKGAHSKSYKEASADKEGGSSRGKKRGKTAEAKSEDDEHEDEDGDGEDENNDGQEAAEAEAEEKPPAKKNKRGAANKKNEQEQDIENGKDDVEVEDKKSKKTSKAKQAKKRTTAATDVEPAPVKETTSRKQNSANSKKQTQDAEEKEDNVEEEEADIKEEQPEQQPPNPEKKIKKERPPTDDEIKAFVKTILDDANLEEITMKTVCKQVFEHFPDFDLSNKKEFIKVTVKSFIS